MDSEFRNRGQDYCIYRASNENLIKEHAQLGGFPANIIAEVSTTIDPSTAEG
jgi:hypothetical protein